MIPSRSRISVRSTAVGVAALRRGVETVRSESCTLLTLTRRLRRVQLTAQSRNEGSIRKLSAIQPDAQGNPATFL